MLDGCHAVGAGGLGRGRYQHSAFLVLAILNLVGPLMGLPFLTGSLPHSPQFVRALTVPASSRAANADAAEGGGGGVMVAESRVAPLIVYLLIGVPLLAPRLIASCCRTLPRRTPTTPPKVALIDIALIVTWPNTQIYLSRRLFLLSEPIEVPAHLSRVARI